MNVHKDAFEHWTARDSADLYGIKDWGAGYFDINDKGELVVTAFGPKGPAVSLMEIVNGIQERGMDMPVLLRLRNILDTQIRLLHASFRKAIQQTNYTGQYRGVYPIKVNQQQQVIPLRTRIPSRIRGGKQSRTHRRNRKYDGSGRVSRLQRLQG